MAAIEVSYLAAAGAGVVSFLSPCVLPLVPAYLCYIAGATFEELTGNDGTEKISAARVVVPALAFVFGFGTVFMLLGASASAINQLVFQHLDVIAKVAGGVIVVFGLHLMGVFRIPWLLREARIHAEPKQTGLIGAFVVGMAFAFGWTPCIGPILATILTVAASRDSLGFGVSLLGTYALGLGIPFVLAALAIRPFMGFMARFRRHLRRVEFVTGALLALTGVLIFTGSLSQLGFYLLETFPVLSTLG